MLVHFLFQSLFFHSIGRFIVDSGKELVVPWLLLDGKALYRDIFWLYGPWAPNFNAVLYQLFGVHTDVLLWAAKFLGAGVVLTVYFCLRTLCQPRLAFAGALGVLALSTTSNYFTWPYSFSNLWATFLALLAVYWIVRWWQTGKKTLLCLSALCAAIVISCKFIIAFPVLVLLWVLLVVAKKFALPTPQPLSRPWLAASLYTAFTLGVFAITLWYYGRDVSPDSYRLQIGAVFHAKHLINAELYDRLRETAFLQNGFSPETIAAAITVWLCPLSVLFGLAVWLHAWFSTPVQRAQLLIPLPFALFALGSLLQMNSSVHAPYVYPASAVVLFWGIQHLRSTGTLRTFHLLLPALVTVFCLLLGGARLYKLSEYTGKVISPRYKFRWEQGHADWLNPLADYVQKHTQESDRIIVFGSRDYLYMICNRKPALGYLYTWYEPFHNTEAAAKVVASLKSGSVPLIITSPLEPFSLAFPENYRTHAIYQTLEQEYKPIAFPELAGQVIVWEKKPK